MGKVAIVTGAARGIGLATTELLLSEGTTVVMVDIDNDELTKAATSLDNVLAIPCDISDPVQVAQMIEQTVEKLHKIDCLINNAGVAEFGPIEKTNIAQAIVFLCSDKSSYVTGQVLAVDGGFESTGVGLPSLRV